MPAALAERLVRATARLLSTSSDSLKPCGPDSLMPLSSNKLWEAESSRRDRARSDWYGIATAGVGIGRQQHVNTDRGEDAPWPSATH